MSSLKRKRVAYEAGFTLKTLEYAKTHDNSKAAREFGVGESMIRDWRKKEQQLLAMPNTKRMRRGDVASFPELEEEVKDWVVEQRQNGFIVTRESLRLRALQLKKSDKYKNVLGMATFLVSAGWCSRFMERHQLTLRQRTNIAHSTCIIPTVHSHFHKNCC